MRRVRAREMSNIIATWSMELNCYCPKCGEYVDLTLAADFWDGKDHIQVCEHGTPATTDMEVICPKCGEEFEVDCQY